MSDNNNESPVPKVVEPTEEQGTTGEKEPLGSPVRPVSGGSPAKNGSSPEKTKSEAELLGLYKRGHPASAIVKRVVARGLSSTRYDSYRTLAKLKAVVLERDDELLNIARYCQDQDSQIKRLKKDVFHVRRHFQVC